MCGDPKNTCERSLCECDLDFAKQIAEYKDRIPDVHRFNLFLNGAAMGDENSFHPKRDCQPEVQRNEKAAGDHTAQVSEVILGHSVDPAAVHCPSVNCWTFNEVDQKCELKAIQSCYTLSCEFDRIEFEFGQDFFGSQSTDEILVNDPEQCKPTFDANASKWSFSSLLSDCGNKINVKNIDNQE